MADDKHPKGGSPKPIPRQNVKEDKKIQSATDGGGSSSSPVHPECPVCLQPSIHPVRVPCGHVFCFLCVKGAANQSQRCALCRQTIPPAFFESPTLLNGIESVVEGSAVTTDRYGWFYEGRNGWWQYDQRTNHEIEDGYRSKKRSFELLIAGYMYIIDLDNMSQMRRSDPSRRRRIKRDLSTAAKKGIAGLKIVTDEGDEIIPESSSGEGEEGQTVDSVPVSQLATSAPGNTAGSTRELDDEPSFHSLPPSSDSSPEWSGDHLSNDLESLSLSHDGQESLFDARVQDEVHRVETDDSDEDIEI